MKKHISTSDRKNLDFQQKKICSNNKSLFIIIPIEVIEKIVSLCGIIKIHVLRFVCKKFHQLAHKYGTIQDFYFWVKLNDYARISFEAAKEGQLSILEWMKMCFLPEQFFINNKSTCDGAASGGHLKVLKWARKNGYDWDVYTCSCAAEFGHLEILKWARENGCCWNERTCSQAALNGHLDVLKWARENRCPWDKWTCHNAALNGHLKVLKWAKKNGCPWDDWTCSYAASGGHLEILKWARENGCPWNEETCINAEIYGHLEVLKWAKENNCP
jgi:hypothetical protein